MKTRAVRLYGESDLRLEEFDMGELKDDEILMELITDSVCMSTYKESIQGAKHQRVNPHPAARTGHGSHRPP